jgi:hypothetical protein
MFNYNNIHPAVYVLYILQNITYIFHNLLYIMCNVFHALIAVRQYVIPEVTCRQKCYMKVPVAARSKASVHGHSPAAIVGSNTTGLL